MFPNGHLILWLLGNFILYGLRATGVPNTMKGYFALCEVGSALGVVLEIDMELLRTHDLARIKEGVKDPFKIHFKTLTTPKFLTYDVYFTMESVVEIGWSERKSILSQLQMI